MRTRKILNTDTFDAGQLLDISKKIYQYLSDNQIMITVTYLPSILNVRTDWESRDVETYSRWQVLFSVFQTITKIMGQPKINLFASRLSNQ